MTGIIFVDHQHRFLEGKGVPKLKVNKRAGFNALREEE
jgi:hypothetical protein